MTTLAIVVLLIVAGLCFALYKAHKVLELERSFNEFLNTAKYHNYDPGIVFWVFVIGENLRNIYYGNTVMPYADAEIIKMGLDELRASKAKMDNLNQLMNAGFQNQVISILRMFPRKKRKILEDVLPKQQKEKHEKVVINEMG